MDMDLRQEPKYRVLVERGGYDFYVDFHYDNLPQFCNFCNCIGHQQAFYKRANPKIATNEIKKDNAEKVLPRKQKQQFVVTKDKRNEVVNIDDTTSEADEVSGNVGNKTQVIDVDKLTQNMDSHVIELVNNQENFVNHASEDDMDSTNSEFVDATQVQNE